MHLQFFHSDHFWIKSITKSNRPIGIFSYSSNMKKSRYRNCLVIFTSIEKTDEKLNCDAAIKEIVNIYKEIKSNSIVIVPYSHQANIETNSQKALGLLQYLFQNLQETCQEVPVYFGDFGYNNAWNIRVKSHKLSCLYRKI